MNSRSRRAGLPSRLLVSACAVATGCCASTLLHPASALAAPSATAAHPAQTRRVPTSVLYDQAVSFVKAEDYLGLRVFVKKLYARQITYGEWFRIKGLVNSQAQNIGLDMINVWNFRNPGAKSNLDKTLEYADSLMLAEKFEPAFVEYQKMAQYIKKNLALLASKDIPSWQERKRDLASLYPFVLHSMGRALYGAGRYDEAVTVYRWIPPIYVRYRQTLFERMWAAFRAGDVNWTLGAIASQRASFFSAYLSPETYLIQTYIYRKLCRTGELNEVVAELKRYQDALARGSTAEWAGSDLETRILWSLANGVPRDVEATARLISRAEKEKEQKEIRAALDRAFAVARPKLLGDIKMVLAYSYIAGASDSSAILRPIESLKSREQLMKLDMEVWPAESTEEWADEIGKHYFIGESKCASAKPQS